MFKGFISSNKAETATNITVANYEKYSVGVVWASLIEYNPSIGRVMLDKTEGCLADPDCVALIKANPAVAMSVLHQKKSDVTHVTTSATIMPVAAETGLPLVINPVKFDQSALSAMAEVERVHVGDITLQVFDSIVIPQKIAKHDCIQIQPKYVIPIRAVFSHCVSTVLEGKPTLKVMTIPETRQHMYSSIAPTLVQDKLYQVVAQGANKVGTCRSYIDGMLKSDEMIKGAVPATCNVMNSLFQTCTLEESKLVGSRQYAVVARLRECGKNVLGLQTTTVVRTGAPPLAKVGIRDANTYHHKTRQALGKDSSGGGLLKGLYASIDMMDTKTASVCEHIVAFRNIDFDVYDRVILYKPKESFIHWANSVLGDKQVYMVGDYPWSKKTKKDTWIIVPARCKLQTVLSMDLSEYSYVAPKEEEDQGEYGYEDNGQDTPDPNVKASVTTVESSSSSSADVPTIIENSKCLIIDCTDPVCQPYVASRNTPDLKKNNLASIEMIAAIKLCVLSGFDYVVETKVYEGMNLLDSTIKDMIQSGSPHTMSVYVGSFAAIGKFSTLTRIQQIDHVCKESVVANNAMNLCAAKMINYPNYVYPVSENFKWLVPPILWLDIKILWADATYDDSLDDYVTLGDTPGDVDFKGRKRRIITDSDVAERSGRLKGKENEDYDSDTENDGIQDYAFNPKFSSEADSKK